MIAACSVNAKMALFQNVLDGACGGGGWIMAATAVCIAEGGNQSPSVNSARDISVNVHRADDGLDASEGTCADGDQARMSKMDGRGQGTDAETAAHKADCPIATVNSRDPVIEVIMTCIFL